MNAKWEKLNVNSCLELEDGNYLSYNDSYDLNLAHEPELAIVQKGETWEKTNYAILYGAKPEDFENLKTIDECLELGRRLVSEGKSRNAFWTGYDFEEGKWYGGENETKTV